MSKTPHQPAPTPDATFALDQAAKAAKEGAEKNKQRADTAETVEKGSTNIREQIQNSIPKVEKIGDPEKTPQNPPQLKQKIKLGDQKDSPEASITYPENPNPNHPTAIVIRVKKPNQKPDPKKDQAFFQQLQQQKQKLGNTIVLEIESPTGKKLNLETLSSMAKAAAKFRQLHTDLTKQADKIAVAIEKDQHDQADYQNLIDSAKKLASKSKDQGVMVYDPSIPDDFQKTLTEITGSQPEPATTFPSGFKAPSDSAPSIQPASPSQANSVPSSSAGPIDVPYSSSPTSSSPPSPQSTPSSQPQTTATEPELSPSSLESVPKLEGKSGFIGDSILNLGQIPSYKHRWAQEGISTEQVSNHLKVEYSESLTHGGKTSGYLLDKLQQFPNLFRNFNRVTILLGTNDIGGQTPQQYAENITAIVKELRSRGVNNIHLCTIPPFGNHSLYQNKTVKVKIDPQTKTPAHPPTPQSPVESISIEQNRLYYNQWLRQNAAPLGINIIPLDQPYPNGLASPDDPKSLAGNLRQGKDEIHPKQEQLYSIIGAHIHKIETGQ